jgi:glucose 1-dehydrogenase
VPRSSCDIARAQGENAAKAITAAGGTASFLVCDVSKPAAVVTAVEAAIAAYRRIDILVNNAGILDDAPFLDLSLQEFDRVMAVNLRGAFLMGQAVARQFVRQRTPVTRPKGQAKHRAIEQAHTRSRWRG